MKQPAIRREREPLYGAFIVILTWLGLCMIIGSDPFGHASHDSYTLMALAWRKGMVSLGQDYPWLELAIYNGDWYVSFPSVPALVMLPLTFLFGEQTPDTLVTGLYLLAAYAGAYMLARRFRPARSACFMALFMTLGCSLLDLSLTGDVWNQAQLMCFMLTTFAALGVTSERPAGWAAGLGCIALSVGCRPFQAVYVPFCLYMLYRKLRARFPRCSVPRLLLKAVPYLIFPALVAFALGWYNYIRFGDPLEFGHNYLPEFTRDPDKPQMGLRYVLGNIRNLLRLPWFEDGRLVFERFDGFAFWLVNPMWVTAFIAGVLKIVRRRWDTADTLLACGFAVGTFLLLMHKSFGGWQFGARYLCDLIPMMLLFELRGTKRSTSWETWIGLFAIAFNIYGSIVFHMLS